MDDLAERAEHVFVVRMWQAGSGGMTSRWRGSVQHVGSTQRIYFTNLTDLTDFMGARLVEPVELKGEGKTKDRTS